MSQIPVWVEAMMAAMSRSLADLAIVLSPAVPRVPRGGDLLLTVCPHTEANRSKIDRCLCPSRHANALTSKPEPMPSNRWFMLGRGASPTVCCAKLSER